MNRAQRRATAKRAARAATARKPLSEAVCAVKGHQDPEAWTLRPAWVGAGIRIPKVHYDKSCRRCGRTHREWRDVAGEPIALDRTMQIAAWLEQTGATIVDPPDGPVVFPLEQPPA